MQINELSGEPLIDADDKIVDPLQNTSYTGHYRGKQYASCVTKLEIGKKFFREIESSGQRKRKGKKH